MPTQSASLPRDAVRLNALQSSLLYSRVILESIAHRMLLRRQRHEQQVSSDYDVGEWANEKSAQNWLNVPTLEAYADKRWAKKAIVAEMDGHLWHVDASSYYGFRRKKLIDILGRYDLEGDTIIELGSGTGSNLFALATSDRWKRIVGLELSATGRSVADAVKRHFDLADKVMVDEINLLDRSSPGFRKVEGAVCFTHYCLEQLPRDTERVMRNLIDAGARRVIMIEPTFELLNPVSLKDQASRTYVLRQDYQRSIVKVARALEEQNLLKIITLDRLDFVSSCRNAPTLLVWDNAKV